MDDDHKIHEIEDETDTDETSEKFDIKGLLKEATFSGIGEFLRIVGNALKRLGS